MYLLNQFDALMFRLYKTFMKDTLHRYVAHKITLLLVRFEPKLVYYQRRKESLTISEISIFHFSVET